MYVCTWGIYYAVRIWFRVSQYFSFQACERVRHLGCLSAQAVASRYDKYSFILFVFGELSYKAYELFLEDRVRKTPVRFGTVSSSPYLATWVNNVYCDT